MLAVEGDISQPATADRITGDALARFGRIDTLVNNAGVFVSKPFTDYTAQDHALMVGVNASAPEEQFNRGYRACRRSTLLAYAVGDSG